MTEICLRCSMWYCQLVTNILSAPVLTSRCQQLIMGSRFSSLTRKVMVINSSTTRNQRLWGDILLLPFQCWLCFGNLTLCTLVPYPASLEFDSCCFGIQHSNRVPSKALMGLSEWPLAWLLQSSRCDKLRLTMLIQQDTDLSKGS